MDLDNFGYSILASVIAGIIIAVAAKFSLQQWKKIGVSLSGLLAIIAIATPMVFMGITATKQIQEKIEVGKAQDVLDTYLKGHYPVDLKEGYNLEVLEVKNRMFIAFIYPENQGYPSYHPWSNEGFSLKIQEHLNNHGYPGRPMWSYQMKTYSSEEILEFSSE
ncbi:hypothetical protein QT231_03310 [Halomonas sp. SpR1]|uniref:hypothetical protein n=1 Tax=Halomonas sp. SpR1 TaxID=3050462 RepID=UPI0027E58FFD|nr:hypothetical protein [Halomonas sp. SpR1]MDQ7731710.1 hypothetical protein [Halomonas sp. SpR1]